MLFMGIVAGALLFLCGLIAEAALFFFAGRPLGAAAIGIAIVAHMRDGGGKLWPTSWPRGRRRRAGRAVGQAAAPIRRLRRYSQNFARESDPGVWRRHQLLVDVDGNGKIEAVSFGYFEPYLGALPFGLERTSTPEEVRTKLGDPDYDAAAQSINGGRTWRYYAPELI